MKASYKITITGDRYPTEYNISASNWKQAIGKAIVQWKQRFKGNRTNELRILAVKLNSLKIPAEAKKMPGFSEEQYKEMIEDKCKCPDGYHDLFIKCRGY